MFQVFFTTFIHTIINTYGRICYWSQWKEKEQSGSKWNNKGAQLVQCIER